jgi:hypothetical protein
MRNMKREPNVRKGQNPAKRGKILSKQGRRNIGHLEKRKRKTHNRKTI